MPAQRAQRAALAALAITVLLTAAKFGVWAATSSLAVLSQALDSLIDVVALGLVFVGVRIAGKPADETHHYGHTKADNLVAFTQTVVLGAIVASVVYHALARLASGSPDLRAPNYAVALLAGSAVVDALRAQILLRTARTESSEALKAGAINIVSDIGTALVALVSLLLVRSGIERADAFGALVVAVPVSVAAFRLGKRSADVLMDRVPGDPAAAIEEAAARTPGVAETRRVRVRGDDKQLFADVTVAAGRTTSLERAHQIAERVEGEIESEVPGADVIVHVEPAPETGDVVERAHAAASRTDGVHEVHNVQAHAFDEGGERKLHVTLHAKVDPETSLQRAHELADRIEAAVEDELGSVRVDTHIEPLPSTETSQDVTAKRADVVATVAELARREPDVLDCHEVLVTSTGRELSIVAHVRGRGDLPLTSIHDASERMEKALRALHPEVGPVLIHFEPGDQAR